MKDRVQPWPVRAPKRESAIGLVPLQATDFLTNLNNLVARLAEFPEMTLEDQGTWLAWANANPMWQRAIKAIFETDPDEH